MPQLNSRAAAKWLALLALSAVLSWPLDRADFPAAFLLGPMIAAIAFGVMDSRLKMPRVALIGGQSIVGCLVATALTGSILLSIAQDWAPILAVTVATI